MEETIEKKISGAFVMQEILRLRKHCLEDRMQMRDLTAILDNQAEYYETLRVNRAKIGILGSMRKSRRVVFIKGKEVWQ